MITPDTKDWTWVLATPCPECGYDAQTVPPADIGDRVRAALPRWEAVLRRPDVPGPPGARRVVRRRSTPATCATCSGSSTSGSS